MSAAAPPEFMNLTVTDAASFAFAAHAGPQAIADLERYRSYLAEWNEVMNLVGPATLDVFWSRHAWDSAQILPLAPEALTWADLGTGASDAEAAIRHAQRICVAGSRAAGLSGPLDGVHLDVKDAAGAEAAMREARAMGFGGKLAIHPAQVVPLRVGLAPAEEEVAWAREVDTAYAEAQAAGSGAIVVRGRLVDEPVARRAREILAVAGAA